jgi:hypothetical protein
LFSRGDGKVGIHGMSVIFRARPRRPAPRVN